MNASLDSAEVTIRDIVSGTIDPREDLVALSRYVLQIVEMDVPCFAYVIPYRKVGLSRRGYFVVVFLKTIEHRRIKLFDCHTAIKEKALSFARYVLSQFGLYIFHSHCVCDMPWQRGRKS